METGSEEGTVDTYGTILSSLYYGNDEDAEVQSEVSDTEENAPSNRATNPPRYAQIARETPSTVSQISGWTDRKNEELVKLQEQHSILETKFDKVTEELGELKDLLQQLLVQNMQPPTKKQATFETPKRSEKKTQRNVNDMDTECDLTETDLMTGNHQQWQE